jgi:hypothetical protein
LYYDEKSRKARKAGQPNPKAHNWIASFERGTWVCGWYAELFVIMLSFAWISAKECVWLTYDSSDRRPEPHSWVRVGDYYYDITRDDNDNNETWWKKSPRSKEEYEYFKLPRDIMYANRFDDWGITDANEQRIKGLLPKERERLIMQNLAEAYKKYKSQGYELQNYLLLRPFVFKDKYWIPLEKEISVEDLDLGKMSKKMSKGSIFFDKAKWKYVYRDQNWGVHKIIGGWFSDKQKILDMLKYLNYDDTKFTIVPYYEKGSNTPTSYVLIKNENIENF